VREQRQQLRRLAVTVVIGAVLGGILLLTMPPGDFRKVVPYLLLVACALFAAQPWLASRLGAAAGRGGDGSGRARRAPVVLLHGACFLAAVYGAYFGAAMGVVLLAVLGLATSEPLVRVNGLRSVLSLIINTVALVIFVAHAHVAWGAAGLMDGSALVGGYVGARVARRIPAPLLRAVVVVVGLVTAVYLLVD
jgi:hypothetical protein